mmetsp:Transcript_17236/g.40743  ORF Transcript_17236/g.40743 Transcript_17236/m.40743 type:complete len:215 (+) Transcript_17236:2-646(+)
MNWPPAPPSWMATEMSAETFTRALTPKVSPSMEKRRGVAPAIAIPVTVRVANSCQYSVTQRVARAGSWPRKSTEQKRFFRGSESANHPMRRATGAPRRKKATEIAPPSFSSRSRGVKPKSSPIAVRLGAMSCVSANRNATRRQKSTTFHDAARPEIPTSTPPARNGADSSATDSGDASFDGEAVMLSDSSRWESLSFIFAGRSVRDIPSPRFVI